MKHIQIQDPLYKLGQKVGVINPDCPIRIDPAYIIGIELDKHGRDYTYTIADSWEELRGFKFISDGWRESNLTGEESINSE